MDMVMVWTKGDKRTDDNLLFDGTYEQFSEQFGWKPDRESIEWGCEYDNMIPQFYTVD